MIIIAAVAGAATTTIAGRHDLLLVSMLLEIQLQIRRKNQNLG